MFLAFLLSYGAIVVTMVAAGTVLPLPEEIVLLSLGYAASAKAVHLWGALTACVIGALIGDNFLFGIARHGGKYAEWLYELLLSSKAGKIARKEDTYPALYIVVGRFIIGIRTLGPLVAAHQGMSWLRFAFWDAVAVLLYVPTIFFLGFHFHHSILAFIDDVRTAKHLIFIVLIVLIGLYVSWSWRSAWLRSKK
ncbi:MAG: VTT domain-containing protein [Candidatus Pacebacteria bacterium]|nr:VTT domain-containing protein [Candidatus Paceibacterota bacterium]